MQQATFNTLVRPYLVLKIGLSMAASIIGLPLAVIWFCGVGQWWARHYYDKMLCVLEDRSIRFKKGIFIEVEKTIPLENIQDITFIEGPILRRFHLSILKFETAGHSEGQAHDMQLVGIIEAHEFRARILEKRDALRARSTTESVTDVLLRIEQLLERLVVDKASKA
jgi:membrane protein YdbS with pleckstrin-like domain